jgi:hypothetical protein
MLFMKWSLVAITLITVFFLVLSIATGNALLSCQV